MPLKIYSDGGSRGNPGHSAFAVVVCRDDEIVHKYAEYIGVGTNNAAEYRGLIYAIGYAVDSGEDEVEFIMDSKLVTEQMKGNFKVRSDNIAGLHGDAKAMASNIRYARFTHRRRSDPMITMADALLNIELDARSEVN
ncbi:MAG: ribonuclease HI family protein [Methanomassiliicoccaceae archaeon]|nr:ribonuclease HI family protein [Methanomassiliicoccaceae archaeon]